MSVNRYAIISFILSVVSAGMSAYHFLVHPAVDFRLMASVVSLAAFFLAVINFKKYASVYELFGILFSLITLGISIDHNLPFIPFITISLLLSFLSYKRYFRKWFSETDALWLDPVLVIASFACYVYANIYYGYGWKGWVLPALALILNAILTIADFIYSLIALKYIAKKKQNVEIGKTAPGFSLPDKDGNTISLSDYKNKQHVLLIFIRTDWCPSCRIKLRTYEKHREKFQEKDIQLLTISPSNAEANRNMVMNIGIDFNVLSDPTQEIAKNYGVQLPTEVVGEKYDPGLPLPASFLIDKYGVVRYTSRPDRIGEFLDPTTIFPALENLN